MAITLTPEFYLNLITSEHSDKSKYMGWIRVLITPFIDSIKLNDDIKHVFNLNSATGAQLDLIGKILVLDRRVNFEPTDGSSSVLNDDYYRVILKAKVVKNQWKGTISDFYNFWNVLFANSPLQIYLIDNQDMDPIAVVWSSAVDDMTSDLLLNNYIIPKPAGLGLTVRKIDPDTLFGFYGSGLQGFDNGTFWNL